MKHILLSIIAATAIAGCSAERTAVASESTSVISQQLPELSGDYIWDMIPEESRLGFEAYYNGQLIGTFERFDTAIKLNPAAPETGEIHAVIDLTSVSVKDNDVKSNLAAPDWFDTKSYPHAIFKSSDIKSTGDGAFLATGTLTIKGISQPADLIFTLAVDGEIAKASGEAQISRKDFKIGSGADFQTEDWVKFPVTVRIDITAKQR